MTTDVFAERLKELRIEAKLSLEELAQALGVTAQSLSLYERAKRTINIDLLYQISKYFNVSADYLIGLSDVPSLDTNIQAVCEFTGLSEKAIESIKNIACCVPSDDEYNILEDVFTSETFQEIIFGFVSLDELSQFCSYKNNSNVEYYVAYKLKISIDEAKELLEAKENELQQEFENSSVFEKFEHLYNDYDKACDVLRYENIKFLEELSNRFDHREDLCSFDERKLKEYLNYKK